MLFPMWLALYSFSYLIPRNCPRKLNSIIICSEVSSLNVPPSPLLQKSEVLDVFPGASQNYPSVWKLLIFIFLPHEAVFCSFLSLWQLAQGLVQSRHLVTVGRDQ